MNQLYPLVEAILQSNADQGFNNLLEALKNSPGQKSGGFNMPENWSYAFKRFINASLAKDPQIKFNSYLALQILLQQGIKQGALANLQKDSKELLDFIIQASNWKRNFIQKSQTIHYAIGRIVAIKALKEIFKNQQAAIQGLVEVLNSFPKIEEQTLQAIYLLCITKQAKKQFKKITPVSTKAKFLHSILLNNFTKTKNPIIMAQNNQFQEILQEIVVQYPRDSLTLQYLGLNLLTSLQQKITPSQFFTKYSEKYFQEDTQPNFKQIYYLLTMFLTFHSKITITSENLQQCLSTKMIKLWLEQLRVMNKKIKYLAQRIKINFELTPQLAYEVLIKLHQEEVYLENINLKHPLYQLFEIVNPQKYWKYIAEKCTMSQSIEQQDLDTPPPTYYNELQFFSRINYEKLPNENLSETITILLFYYKKNEKQQHNLNLLWSFINSIFQQIYRKNAKKSKETQKGIENRIIQIIRNVNLNKIKLEEEHKQLFNQKIKNFRKRFLKQQSILKGVDSSLSAIYNNFEIFNLAIITYTLIYPQQLEICQQLQALYNDLLTVLKKQAQPPKPKKKVKKNVEAESSEDPKKPIHVLVDIFISLLTKAPQFVRNTINALFQDVIEFIDQSDLSSIVEVIEKPDQEYIEEI